MRDRLPPWHHGATGAAALGHRLLTWLETLRDLPGVGDIRGLGLMAGIELVTDKRAKTPAIGLGERVLGEARRRGLITRMRAGQTGEAPIGDVVCLAPPLVTSQSQVDRIVEILRESILAVAG